MLLMLLYAMLKHKLNSACNHRFNVFGQSYSVYSSYRGNDA